MTVIHNQPYAKPIAIIGHYQPMVDTSSLSAHHKKLLWLGIKHLAPGVADLLKNDPNIERLKQQFNATVQFTEADYNDYLQAGQIAMDDSK